MLMTSDSSASKTEVKAVLWLVVHVPLIYQSAWNWTAIDAEITFASLNPNA